MPGASTPRHSFVEHSGDRGFHLVDLAQSVDGFELAIGIVIADQRRGFLVVFHQALLEAVLVVVGAALELRATTFGAYAIRGDRLGDVVIDFTKPIPADGI